MLKVTPLFSGSKGNCTLIQSKNTNILLDAGFGYKNIVQALKKNGVYPSDVDAIVITHEHSDHVSALAVWAKHYTTPIFVPSAIVNCIVSKSCSTNVHGVCDSFDIGDVSVDIYQCSHDSQDCFGYRFGCLGDYVASVTDTGCWSDETIDFLSPCKTIMLESNHDVGMLRRGDYPYPLKQRILSNYGHLSNGQTSCILERLIGSKVKNVLLAHLSEENNTKELVFSTAVTTYSKYNLTEGKDVNVYVVDQYENEVSFE